jgi:hypothetical protein
MIFSQRRDFLLCAFDSLLRCALAHRLLDHDRGSMRMLSVAQSIPEVKVDWRIYPDFVGIIAGTDASAVTTANMLPSMGTNRSKPATANCVTLSSREAAVTRFNKSMQPDTISFISTRRTRNFDVPIATPVDLRNSFAREDGGIG